jgi:hypothetical protein
MKTIMLISILLVGLNVNAAKISDVELYQRCHSHLTGEAVKFSDPVLASVVSKKTTAVKACSDLLNLAKLNGSNPLPKSNVKGIKVLDTFYKVHANWFETRIFDGDLVNNADIYEASPGALYFTKALFDSKFSYSDIFKGKVSFEAARSNGVPDLSVKRRQPASFYEYLQGNSSPSVMVPMPNLIFPEVGLLEGIRPEKEYSIDNFRTVAGKTVLNGSLGGGIVGNMNYIMKNVKERGYRADGAVNVPRRYGRSIFVDFLCQDVPVVNFTTDVEPYVDPASSTPFRTSNGCVACHASMDQLSGLVRNYNATSIDPNDATRVAPMFHNITIPTAPYEWKSDGDRDYYRQASKGKFYYRTIDGQLINRDLNDFNALGNLMGQLDDVYMCTASRYLEHFTGVKFPIPNVKQQPEHIYSKAIRSLAQDLKSSQSPLDVVQKIISSDIYSDSKFKVGE